MRYSLKLLLLGLGMITFYVTLRLIGFPAPHHPGLAAGLGIMAGLFLVWRYRQEFIETVVHIDWDRPIAERTTQQQWEGTVVQAVGAQSGGRGGTLGAAAAFVGLLLLGGSFVSNATLFAISFVATLLLSFAWIAWGLERAYQARRQTPGHVQEPQEQI
jgi:hypothetical protein